MKRLFSKASRNPLPPKPASPAPVHTIVTGPTLQPKYTVPPVPHPCPYEYIALLVTTTGLLLRPHITGLKHPGSHVCIKWGKGADIEEYTSDTPDVDWKESVVVYGILGILELFSGSHLLVVTSRSDLGHLLAPTHAVYGVKGVTAIPLIEDRARIVLNTLFSRNSALSRPSLLSHDTTDSVSSHTSTLDDSDTPTQSGTVTPRVKFSSEEQVKVVTPLATEGHDRRRDSQPDVLSSSSSSGASTPSDDSISGSPIAKTLANRLSFWSRLSKRTTQPSSTEEDISRIRESLDSIIQEGADAPAEVLESILAATAPPPTSTEEKHSELEDKVVKECVREFSKGDMFFSYNFDLTRSLQYKQELTAKYKRKNALLADLNALDHHDQMQPNEDTINVFAEPQSMLPLWRRVDRKFWWNEWMSKPFMDAGLHSYVLPIMQGYFQIGSFHIPREPVAGEEGDSVVPEYVIISRRSKDRAGLRYQRRGVDDDAHVANFVETETIMRVEREGVSNIFSYVQIRGSIPLFWTQSGYGLKPPPSLSPERTHAQNMDALKRHLQATVPRYGPLTIVNLAEQHGKEAAITSAFREYMAELDWKDAQYNEYDFHKETRGMKYENISHLLEKMERVFESQGYFWISDNSLMSQQKGVFRVNCIDCLDRTNVVQSAFARHIMNRQLGAVALLNPTDVGRTETDIVFMDLWANNGDAISRAYAGTSALKGDFTRTGKRDLGGMLNDGVNSLARMYTSTFSDWFCQAVIDFMLGHRTISVFSEFLLKLQSTDPRELIRLSKIRAEAIATSVSRVLPEGERLLTGWTLFAPEEMNTKMGEKFEEKVLLLTAQALYIISYDYTLEKVKIYTRVPLGDIIGITKGAYILSPLEEASRDPQQNAGFVISWSKSHQTTRMTTYSLRNSLDSISSSAAAAPIPPTSEPASTTPNGSPRNSTFPRTTNLSRKSAILSRMISVASLAATGDTNFAAFKALPIDPARFRRGSSVSGTDGYAEPADELTGARNCMEAVDMMTDAIWHACEDIGGGQGEFIKTEDVVSLAEAQRMTSVYAKMEYGVKRLLWLGG